MTGPIVPLILAGALVWAGSVIEDGYRIRQAEKRNPIRALRRIYERSDR